MLFNRITPDRNQLIESIRALNSTARPAWLRRFRTSALKSYLDHLEYAQEPRAASSVWVRQGDTPAVVTNSDEIGGGTEWSMR
ncbi:MAG: hypothetical protein ACR2GY_04810 [Phycisphaerales bacterium]